MSDPAELALLRRARDAVDRSYAEPLDVAALARVVHMSVGHFARRFRDEFGETPYSYLMTRRIERAMTLLRRGDVSVAEASVQVGATSIGSFSSRFAEVVGMSPSAYRAIDHSAIGRVPGCIAKRVGRPRRRDRSVSEMPAGS